MNAVVSSPPAQADQDPFIYAVLATLALFVVLGGIFNIVWMWVIGLVGLFLCFLSWCRDFLIG